MKFFLLPLILLTPALGGANGQLFKVALISLALVLCSRAPHVGFTRNGRRALSACLVALGCAFLGTLTVGGPLWGFTEGLIGRPERVEGWLALAGVVGLTWFGFWNAVEDEKNNFALAMLAVPVGIGLIWLWDGLDLLSITVGTWLSVGTLTAMVIPVGLAWGWSREGDRWAKVVSGSVLALAGLLLVASGCRGAFLGAVVGLVVMWGMSGPVFVRERITGRFVQSTMLRWSSAVVVGLVTLLCAVIPSTNVNVTQSLGAKLTALNPDSWGTGPRSQTFVQLWQHGIMPYGWGVESQGHLIETRNIVGRQVNGVYDRFHAWPADVLAVSGWIGLVACLVALWFIGREAWEHRREWWIRGCAGGATAFLVASLWNPPSIQLILVAGVMVSAICTRPYPENFPRLFASQKVGGERAQMFCLRWIFVGVGAVGSLVYGAMVVGDCFNESAKRRWSEKSALPHAILARQWVSEKLSPWVGKDRVVMYYAMLKERAFLEPMGGKVTLIKLLRDTHSDPALIAMLYAGLRDAEMAKKWLDVVKASTPAAGSPSNRYFSLVVDNKERVWSTMTSVQAGVVERKGADLWIYMWEYSEPGNFISCGRAFRGFKKGTPCRILVEVKNLDSDYHGFVTTDPKWDDRTRFEELDAGFHQYIHTAIADGDGEVKVRIVVEKQGEILIESVEVEEIK